MKTSIALEIVGVLKRRSSSNCSAVSGVYDILWASPVQGGVSKIAFENPAKEFQLKIKLALIGMTDQGASGRKRLSAFVRLLPLLCHGFPLLVEAMVFRPLRARKGPAEIASPWRSSEAAVLVWDKSTKIVIWMLTAIVVGIVYVAPFAVIALASVAGE